MREGNNVHLALFKDVDPASEALDKLREFGIAEDDMTIISGVPFSEKVLGRPILTTNIPKFSIAGFMLGLLAALAINGIAVLQYPIRVGGMANFALPSFFIVAFEMSMLGCLIFTFLAVIWECAFPSYGPKMYRPEISDGRVAIVFNCPPEIHTQVHDALATLGAEWVHRTEATKI